MKPKTINAAISDGTANDSLVRLRYERLKHEVQIGFDALDRGEFSNKTVEEIAADAMSEFKRRSAEAE